MEVWNVTGNIMNEEKKLFHKYKEVEVRSPPIEWDDPKHFIRWELQRDSNRVFKITLENFLIAAKESQSEEEFRRTLYMLGEVEFKEKKNGSRKTKSAGE